MISNSVSQPAEAVLIGPQGFFFKSIFFYLSIFFRENVGHLLCRHTIQFHNFHHLFTKHDRKCGNCYGINLGVKFMMRKQLMMVVLRLHHQLRNATLKCTITFLQCTDPFALAMADEFFQLLQIGQPPVTIVLPGDSSEEVGQSGLLRMAHPSLCKDTSNNISSSNTRAATPAATSARSSTNTPAQAIGFFFLTPKKTINILNI